MSSSKQTSSILQLIISLLVILSSWGSALLLALFGLMQGFALDFDFNSTLSMFMMAAVSVATGCLVIPSAIYSLRSLQGKRDLPAKAQPQRMHLVLLVGLFLVALGLGNLSAQSGAAWLLLPFFHILAISIPVFWLLCLAVRNLPIGSPQRRWGVFAGGLVLGPTLIMLAELFALLALAIAGGLWLASQPELIGELSALAEKMATTPLSQEELVELVQPYLLNPAVFLTALLFIALVVPLIEELIKPIGVWFLLGRKLTPAAGFAAGAISGAGYALFESLLLTMGGENWAAVVLARMGTTTIHMLTTALMGWALVGAWRKKKILRLVLVYAAAVLFHGLWNGVTLFTAFATLAGMQSGSFQLDSVLRIGKFAPYLLGLFSVMAFVLILWANRKLSGVKQPPGDPLLITPQS